MKHEVAVYGWHKKERTVIDSFGVIDDRELPDLNEANLTAARSSISLRRRLAAKRSNPNYGYKYRLVTRPVGDWDYADQLDIKSSGSST